MNEDKRTTPISIDNELRSKISVLIMEQIDSPDKMSELPNVVCTLISSAVGMLMVSEISEEGIVEFVTAVTKATFEVEKDRVEAAKAMADILRTARQE